MWGNNLNLLCHFRCEKILAVAGLKPATLRTLADVLPLSYAASIPHIYVLCSLTRICTVLGVTMVALYYFA